MKERLQIFLALIAVTTITLGGIWLYHQTLGTVIVDLPTGTKVKISVTPALPKVGKTTSTKNTTLRLKPGDYVIAVNSGSATSLTNVSIDRGQTQYIKPTLTNPATPEQLIQYNARFLSGNGQSLYFTNGATKQIYNYQVGHNEPITIGFTPDVQGLWWQHFGTGIAAFGDGTYGLFQSNRIQPLSLNGLVAGVTTNPIALAVAGDRLAYLRGDRLWWRSSPNAPENATGLNVKGYDTIRLSSTGLAIIYISESTVENSSQAATKPLVYDLIHQKVLSLDLKGHNIMGAAWSSDGSRLAYMSENGLFVTEVATNHSATVLNSAINNPDSLTWLDSHRLIFADQGSIWLYEAGKVEVHKAASYSGILQVAQPFGLSTNPNQVYFSTIADQHYTDIGNVYQVEIK